MGDTGNDNDNKNSENKDQIKINDDTEAPEVKIDLGEYNVIKTDNKVTELPSYNPPQGPPPPQGYPQYQNYYYPDQSYANRQTPAYQQRLDGQPVYVAGGYPPPPPPNVSRGGVAYRLGQRDPEEMNYYRNSEIFSSAFNSIKIRNRFVQRVYSILSIQLFFTFGFILFAIYEENTRKFFQQNGFPFMIIGMILFMAIFLILVCCVDLRRRYPINFILLAILTMAMTFLMVAVTVHTETTIVMYAMGTTGLLCLIISLFAWQTKWDVTGCGMCLCIAGLVLAIFGMIVMILSLCGIYYRILHIVYASLATLIFSFYLMYDTQQIMGGRRIELSPEEYIFGALSLYVDIVQIFLNLLVLFQSCASDS